MSAANLLAFVGIGSNLPQGVSSPIALVLRARDELRQLAIDGQVQLSSFYLSDPKDCPPESPVFINAVAAFTPLTELHEAKLLLMATQILELASGRERSVRNAPRTLDLDLLWCRDEVSDTDFLTLPHPRCHLHRYVLEPWIELVGTEFMLKGKSLGEYLALCQDPPLKRL
jgi:2-amino-4-hydroxy-6-hydroxymethyldihydropteridine diphosphokinase